MLRPGSRRVNFRGNNHSYNHENAPQSSLNFVQLPESSKNRKRRYLNYAKVNVANKYKQWNMGKLGMSVLQTVVDFITDVSNANPSVCLIIFGVLATIFMIYLVLIGLTSLFLSSQTQRTPAEDSVNIEINELIGKMVDIRKKGNMMDFDAFLSPIMKQYCVSSMPESFLSTEAMESFHMNLASIVSFVASEHKLTDFENGLRITSDGGIIDAKASHAKQELKQHSVGCPLLEGLKTYADALNTAEVDSSASAAATGSAHQASGESLHRNNGNAAAVDGNPVAVVDRFSKKFDWSTPALYVELMLALMEEECPQLTKTFSLAEQQMFILNFFEICDQIGSRDREQIAADKKSESQKAYQYYLVGKDTHIYAVDKELYAHSKKHEYMKCEAVPEILNTQIYLRNSFDMTNLQIVVEDHPRFKLSKTAKTPQKEISAADQAFIEADDEDDNQEEEEELDDEEAEEVEEYEEANENEYEEYEEHEEEEEEEEENAIDAENDDADEDEDDDEDDEDDENGKEEEEEEVSDCTGTSCTAPGYTDDKEIHDYDDDEEAEVIIKDKSKKVSPKKRKKLSESSNAKQPKGSKTTTKQKQKQKQKKKSKSETATTVSKNIHKAKKRKNKSITKNKGMPNKQET